MLHDVAWPAERCEHIDEAEHLHLEMLIPHGEGHHALVKPGLAEKRLGMAIDQLENFVSALLDLGLQRTHRAIIILATGFGKGDPGIRIRSDPKKLYFLHAQRMAFPRNDNEQRKDQIDMKIKGTIKQQGAAGYILLWLLGIPIPILFLFFLLRGCT